MRAGKLTVNAGGMFSGKSTELLRQGKRHQLAGRKVIYIKPSIDNRYSENEIVTHDGMRVAALNVNRNSFFHDNPHVQDADVILIDEGQFFDRAALTSINGLLLQGKDVIVSGLDMDRYGQPFGIVMPYLLSVAEEVKKFRAVCFNCGADAWVSKGRNLRDQEQIYLGAEESYYPLCRTCFYKGA